MSTTVNGVTFNGIPQQVLLNYKYLVLLNQGFTPDRLVLRSKAVVSLAITSRSGAVVWYTEVPFGGHLLRTPFTINFVTKEPSPFTAFLTLYWYYPNKGVYMKRFRVGSNLTKSGNRFKGSVDLGRLQYATRIRNEWRALIAESKKVRNRSSNAGLRPSPELQNVQYPTYYRFTPQPTWETSGFTTVAEYYRTYAGVRTPGYWTKVKAGRGLPINGFTTRQRTLVYDTIIRHKEFPNYAGSGTTAYEDYIDIVTRWYSVPAFISSFLAGGGSRALSNLRDKMGADTANLAQDIGEIGETIRMAEKTFRRIHNANHALRTGRYGDAISALWTGNDRVMRDRKDIKLVTKGWRTVKSQAKALADNWLELQYGWKPLLADLHDSIEKVSRFAQQSGDIPIYQAKARSKTKSTSTWTATSAYSPTGQQVKGTILVDQTDVYGVRWKVADAHKAFLAQTGFTNPINLIWELLPYSFVVDWALPIGPWLESFTAFQGLEFLDGFYTQFAKENTTLPVNVTGETSNQKWLEYGLFFRTAVMLQRTKLSAWPLPELPHVKSPWSVGHALNAAALMAAGFRSSIAWHV